jgi:hypothetical protein
MTRLASVGKLVLMVEGPEPETLTIRLERGVTPISGVVTSADGETPFTGWIELTGLIEALHSRASASIRPGERKFVDPPR